MVVYDARPSAFTQLTTTSEWEALIDGLGLNDGIDSTVGSQMNPSLDTPGRNIVIAAGNVLIKGQLWRCDASVSTPIPAASAQNRIDRLVLRLTRTASTAASVVTPTVITGTPSGSPVAPPIVQTTTGIYDIPVCSWTSTSAGGLTTLNDERQFILDVWHTLGPFGNGWATQHGRYRLTNLGELEIDVSLTGSGSTGSIGWPSFTLPSSPVNYVPAFTRRIAGVPTSGTCHASINSTGTITLTIPSGAGTFDCVGSVPLT